MQNLTDTHTNIYAAEYKLRWQQRKKEINDNNNSKSSISIQRSNNKYLTPLLLT